jgi:hypothetical protein
LAHVTQNNKQHAQCSHQLFNPPEQRTKLGALVKQRRRLRIVFAFFVFVARMCALRVVYGGVYEKSDAVQQTR